MMAVLTAGVARDTTAVNMVVVVVVGSTRTKWGLQLNLLRRWRRLPRLGFAGHLVEDIATAPEKADE